MGQKKHSSLISSGSLTYKNYAPFSNVPDQGTLLVVSLWCCSTGWSILPSAAPTNAYRPIVNSVSLDVLHFAICSISTLIQLPPGWHSPKPCGRRWAWQPVAQLGASRWEAANISLNPPFLLPSPIPTATVKSLLIMSFCLTHLSPNSSIWDGLKTGKKKKKRREAAHFASWITPLRKVLILSTIFSSFFLSFLLQLLFCIFLFLSLCKKRNQVRKKERRGTLI